MGGVRGMEGDDWEGERRLAVDKTSVNKLTDAGWGKTRKF